ncbi:MAG: phage morphogenesis protein [Peptostreptococcaceae bacterium]|nr:phage morphogenesis protein [Peptostreptococcaceae bacterium]
MIKDMNKLYELGKRIYNNKMVVENNEDGTIKYSDDEAIKALCSKVFDMDGNVSSMEDLRSFNKLIVEVANKEAQAKFEQVVNLVADYKTYGRYDTIQYYKVPQRKQTTVALSASGTGVDFTKIPSKQTKVPAQPKLRQFGVQYSISEMVNDPVNAFRGAVNDVVQAKLLFIFKEIMKLAKNGVAAGKIPTAQQFNGSNMTLANYRTIESKLIRAGRNARPVLIADTAFINDLALKQGTEGLGGTNLSWLTDELRTSLLRDVTFDMVSKSLAVATDNPWIDEKHDKVDIAPNEAILLAGAEGSPFKISEFGGMRTAQDMPSIEKEQVLIKIDYVIDISLINGEMMAYLMDTNIQA